MSYLVKTIKRENKKQTIYSKETFNNCEDLIREIEKQLKGNNHIEILEIYDLEEQERGIND